MPASWPCAPSLAGSCLGKHGLGFISQQLGLGQLHALEREVVRLSRRARKGLRDLALSSPLRLSLLGVYPSVYSGPGLLFSPTHRRCDLALGPSTAIFSA